MSDRDRYELWLRDEVGWKEAVAANATQGYGFCVVAAAALWMLAMQDALAGASQAEREVFGVERAPEELTPEVMDRTSKEAFGALGRWSLTGFQAGACVSIVTKVWERGEEVRRWWNVETQIGDEGEAANKREGAVLNPALLSIGPGEEPGS